MSTNRLLDVAHDTRVDCHSVLALTTVRNFLELVEGVYTNRGGIAGQRPALKTKTAKIIRSRLVDDLSQGAIIPPIVLGAHVNKSEKSRFLDCNDGDKIFAIVKEIGSDSISIIDGMQRTTALLEALSSSPEIGDHPLRVEMWVSEHLNSLIYRMLVLNTGQIPWEISRQLETIYSQLIKMVKNEIGESAQIYLKDDGQRRSDAAQYQASMIVRLYLAFSARRAEFDLKDRVAEDFARLDAIETSSHQRFTDLFIQTFKSLVQLDKAFSSAEQAPKPHKVRIADGREIFQTDPALIGFFVAVSIYLFGEPGFQTDWSTVDERIKIVTEGIDAFSKRLEYMTPAETTEFLQLDYLNERLSVKSGQVGRFERELFVRAFTLIIDKHDQLQDLIPCWVR